MIELKPGVRLQGIRPELVLAVSVAEGIWMAAGAPSLVITAGIEGLHVSASDHYAGDAVDLRTKTLPAGTVKTTVGQLQRALGDDFFILLENEGDANEHCHLSWRPKTSY